MSELSTADSGLIGLASLFDLWACSSKSAEQLCLHVEFGALKMVGRHRVSGFWFGVATSVLAIAMLCCLAISKSEARELPTWGGFHFGAHVGIGTANFDSIFDSSEIPQDLPDDAVFGRFFELDGYISGLHAGYSQVAGSVVYGVELDWTHFGQSDRLFDPNEEGAGTTDNASATINWVSSLRGRAGIASAHSLIYVTGGIAWADVSYTARNADDNNANEGTKNLGTLGYVVGGGIEHALTRRIALRLEGLYYGFNGKKDTAGLNSDSDPGDFAKIEDIIVARLGVSYMLNGASQPQTSNSIQPQVSWDGLYVGGQMGYGLTRFDGLFDGDEIDRGIDIEDSVFGRDFDLNGVLGGGHIGYTSSSGRFVYGIEADWSYLGKSDRVFDPDTEAGGTDNATVDLNWLATVRGRAGISSAQTLFYATAGVAWVDAKFTAQDADVTNVSQGSKSISAPGFVFGGGMEHALNDQLRIRFEALRYQFRRRVDTSTLTSDSDPGDFAGVEDITVARIGLSYRFSSVGQ